MKPIAIDVDDVIAVLKNALYTSLKKRYPSVESPEHWAGFDIYNRYGIPIKEFLDIILEDNLLATIPMARGALKALQALKDSGRPLVLITSRGYAPEALTTGWLAANKVPHDDLIIVPEGMTKAEAAIAKYPQGFLYMVDDLPKNLDDMKNAGLVKYTILIDQPWNQERQDYKEGVSRFESLEDFVISLQRENFKEHLKFPAVSLELAC
ncbi:5' nucleotidase, NT5C type [Pseudomonas serbica]|uniref:5' nucleotidase, NT5C type n=1 Tax=Pseudomonas serbica TaxID=2965074 RepID=UPI00237AFFCF|nr:hypothetical protein [Pseudomonas serbica]